MSGPVRDAPDVAASCFRLHVADGQSIVGCLLAPREVSPSPLIIALHGHGKGLSLLFDSTSYQKGVAVALARSGFRVLALETRSFGDSAVAGATHQAYVQQLRLVGREFHGQVLSDNLEAVQWALKHLGLEEEPELGIVGCSMGGLSAMFLTVFEPRIKAALISGMGGSWRDSFSTHEHCSCSIIPGLLQHLDSPQIFAAMQARRVVIEAGRSDKLLGVGNLARIESDVLSLNRKSDCVYAIHKFDGAHEHDLPFVLDFFRQAHARPVASRDRPR